MEIKTEAIRQLEQEIMETLRKCELQRLKWCEENQNQIKQTKSQQKTLKQWESELLEKEGWLFQKERILWERERSHTMKKTKRWSWWTKLKVD